MADSTARPEKYSRLRAVLTSRARPAPTNSSLVRMLALLAQITLVLLPAYMLLPGLLAEADGAADATPIAARLDRTLIELQRQMLLNACAQVEAEERQRLGLTLYVAPPSGRSGVGPAAPLLQDRVEAPFREAATYAQQVLASAEAQAGWRRALFLRILAGAGLQELGGPQVGLLEAPPVAITPANRRWLEEQVREGARALAAAVRTLHATVLAGLIRYYGERPAAEAPTRAGEVARRCAGAAAADQAALLLQLQRELRQDALAALGRQGVTLYDQ